jgi:sulfite oxidase
VSSISRQAAPTSSAGLSRLVHDQDGLNTASWPSAPNQLVTPIDQFFTRSHASVPIIDPASWRLEVDGLVERPGSFSLEELRSGLPRRQVTATIVCAGLRRNEFLTIGPLPGELPWGPEPASTGQWTGISLRDLLDHVGVGKQARYVEFVGLDQVERHGHHFGFGGSIDLEKALGGDVLLATELNGTPLPRVHGFPLRAIVPGWIGARSVKWLGRVNLLEQPSANYFQSKAYRLQFEIDQRDPRDVSRGVALSELFLNSVILHPTSARAVPAGQIHVYGWAIGAGGRALTTVELSADGGSEWTEARITTGPEGWTWSLWETTLDLPRGRHTLVVRAADTTGVPQPVNVTATWNVKGYSNNAWHRVPIDVVEATNLYPVTQIPPHDSR